MKYSVILNGNVIVSIENGQNRNENVLKLHSNNIGKTIYTNNQIYDSDFLKIIRFLEKNEHSYKDYKEIVLKMTKKCRHLKIERFEIIEI